MADFGIYRGFSDKLFEGKVPVNVGKEGSVTIPSGLFDGLLDTYTGAAAAYSLRQLSSTYTGDAIEVRRASDNSTQDIGFVNNELDTTSLESFCSGTDGFVTTWYDQSGNVRNATQTTAANQPQIVSSGTYLDYIQNTTTTSNAGLVSTYEYKENIGISVFKVVENFGNAVFGGTETFISHYYAVAQSGATTSPAQSNFTSEGYFSNGISIGSTRNDIHNATSSFALLTSLVTKGAGANITSFLGYQNINFNNCRFKEYIIYDNQSVSRTGVEGNIITHYGF